MASISINIFNFIETKAMKLGITFNGCGYGAKTRFKICCEAKRKKNETIK